ncbi:MAG: hypothetical protein ACOYUZ_01435 [Patescibacteria group bacterium]
MMEKLFSNKGVAVQDHPEWLPARGPKTNVDQIPDEFVEQVAGSEVKKPEGDQVKLDLPPVEIPEHLPNWFEITAEALDDLSEDTALGNLAAVGKMGAYDQKIIKDYVAQIPEEALDKIEAVTVEMACEQSKQLAAVITGREQMDDKTLKAQQKQLKKLFNIASCLSVAGREKLKNTLVYLESTYHFASNTNAA